MDMLIIYGECSKNAFAAFAKRLWPTEILIDNVQRESILIENQFRREPNHNAVENFIIDKGI